MGKNKDFFECKFKSMCAGLYTLEHYSELTKHIITSDYHVLSLSEDSEPQFRLTINFY